jgi:hypothetical protein
VTAIEHAGRRQYVERATVALDVQLVARGALERAPAVRTDLGADPLVAEEREGASCCRSAPEVEVEPPLPPAAQMQAPGRMEQA